jgi:hypothetical protein
VLLTPGAVLTGTPLATGFTFSLPQGIQNAVPGGVR